MPKSCGLKMNSGFVEMNWLWCIWYDRYSFVWPQLPLLCLDLPTPKKNNKKNHQNPNVKLFKQLMTWFHWCWWLKNLTPRHHWLIKRHAVMVTHLNIGVMSCPNRTSTFVLWMYLCSHTYRQLSFVVLHICWQMKTFQLL